MNAEGASKLPLLIYDGDCSFCRMWVDYIKCFTGDAISCAPSQQVGCAFPEIPVDGELLISAFLGISRSCYDAVMRDPAVLFIHLITTIARQPRRPSLLHTMRRE
jgi:hypothetical protein